MLRYYPGSHSSYTLSPAEFRIRLGIVLGLLAVVLWRVRDVVVLSLKMAVESLKTMLKRW